MRKFWFYSILLISFNASANYDSARHLIPSSNSTTINRDIFAIQEDQITNKESSALDDRMTWIRRYSANTGKLYKGDLDQSWNDIVEVLNYINLEFATPEGENRRVYVVNVSGISAQLDTKLIPLGIAQERIINAFKLENELNWKRASAKILSELSEELKGRGEFVIILFQRYKYYKGPTANSLEEAAIPSVHFYGKAFERDEEEVKRIKSSFAGKKTMTGVVKSVCASLEREYLTPSAYLINASSEDKVALTPNTPLCKPLDELIEETWPNETTTAYKAAVKGAVRLFQQPDPSEMLHVDIYVDHPDRFSRTDRLDKKGESLSNEDYQYINEILPDKLNASHGKEMISRRIQFLFTRVNFVIPESKRAKFAKDVYDEISEWRKGNEIFVVVPYYSCTDRQDNLQKNKDGKVVGGAVKYFPFLMMPAVYSPDNELNTKMNAILTKELNFTKGFEEAFKQVPKVHIAYVGKVFLNGTISLLATERKEHVTGFSNFVDVGIVVDDRIEKVRPLMNCGKILGGFDTNTKDKVQGIPDRQIPVDDRYDQYRVCLNNTREEIRKIVASNPNPTFKELGAALCYLKQSELVKPEGFDLANLYVSGMIGKYVKKFVNANALNGGDFEEKHMDSKFFYKGKNNLYKKNPILTAIDAGSFLLGFVGLDFIPDAVGAVTAYAFGDNEAAAEFAESIIVTGAIAGVMYKGAKATLKLTKEMLRDIAEGKAVMVLIDGKRMVIASDEIAAVVGIAAKNDGVDLWRRMGLPNEVVDAAATDPNLNGTLVKSLFTVDGDRLVKRTDFDAVLAGLQNPNTIPNFLEAQKKGPITLAKFIEDSNATTKLFAIGERSKKIGNLKEEFPYVTLLLDDEVKLDTKEIAHKMLTEGYTKGKPIRIIYIGDAKKAQKTSEELALELETTAKYYNSNTKVVEATTQASNAGDIVAEDGSSLADVFFKDRWKKTLDYRNILTPERMLCGPNSELKFGSYVIAPFEIDAAGNALCKIGNETKWLTPDDVADLARKNGLRPDAEVFVASTLRKNFKSSQEKISVFCDRLANKLETRVSYGADGKVFYDPEAKSFGTIDEIGGGSTLIANYKWQSTGRLKPFRSFTNTAHGVKGADNGVYIIVEEFSNRKVRISYAPLNQKEEWLDASQLLDKIKKADLQDGKTIHIVPIKGTDNLDDAERFLADLSENAKTEAKISTAAVEAAPGEAIQVNKLKYTSYKPIGEGTHFLNTNVTNPEVLRLLKKYDNPKFMEQLGLTLKENNKKYLAKYTDIKNSNLIEKLYVDYTRYGKVSIPTFENLQSITKQLNIKFLDDAWVKDLWKKAYEKPAFANNLDTQLKWLDLDDLEDLANPENTALLKKAIALVETNTAKGGSKLRYMMALEHLGEKLPKEMAKAVEESFGKDPEFVDFLAGEIRKLDASGLDKFKRYHNAQPDDFLGEFNSLYQSQGRKLGLGDYISLSQRKNQIVFVGAADNTLSVMADKLLPQEGYMDVFLRTDGENFIEILPNGTRRTLAPEDVAREIRQNEFWDERPLRLIVKGDAPLTDVKGPAQRLVDDLDVQGSKINPKNDYQLTEDGRLVSRWESISPDPRAAENLVKETRKFSDPSMMAGLGKDQATLQAVSRLKSEPLVFDVIMHGNVTKNAEGQDLFWLLKDDDWIGLSHRDLDNWLSRKREYREAKTVRLITCGSASTFSNAERALAQNFANKSGKRVIAAGGEIGVAKSGEVVAKGRKEGQWWYFQRATSSSAPAPVPQGKIRKASSADDALSLKFISDDPYETLKENVTYLDWYEQLISGETKRRYDGIISLEEETALNWYVREGPSLNYEMVFGTTPLSGFDLAMKNTITDALGKLRHYNQPVFRGMGKAEFEFVQKAYNSPTKEVVFKDFKSTSKLESVAKTFNKSEGNGVQYIGVFHSHSGLDISATRSGMEEVLIPNNSKFRVKSIEDDGKGIIKVHFEDVSLPRVTDEVVHSPEIEKAFQYFESKPDDSYKNFLQGFQSGTLPRLYPNELSTKQEAVLRHFAAEGNHAVNDAIIGVTGRKLTAELKGEMDIVNDALKKLPKHKGGVFRGAGLAESKQNAELLDRGAKELEFDQFLYSTKSEERAIDYLNHGGDRGYMVYQIKPKSAVDISHFSDTSKYWQELISPTRTKYRVVDRKEIKIADGRVIDYVFLEEL
jgi:hypothetical protein